MSAIHVPRAFGMLVRPECLSYWHRSIRALLIYLAEAAWAYGVYVGCFRRKWACVYVHNTIAMGPVGFAI